MKHAARVDSLTTDPALRKKAKADIKQKEGEWQDTIVKQYAALKGTIQKSLAIPYWDKHQEAPWGPIEKSAEYGKLTATEQTELFKQVDAENWKLRSHKQTIDTQLRVAETAARTERRRAEAESHKQVIEEQHTEANYWRLHPEDLATLSKEKVEALNVGHAEQKELAALYKKVTQPKELRQAVIKSGVAKKLIDKMPGLSETEKNKYLRVIESESEKMDHAMNPEEIERAVTISMASVAKTEKTPMYNFIDKTRKVPARAADVLSADDLATINKLEQKRGVKLPQKQIELLLQELADSKGVK